MTRFARARGSKSSNERAPEDSTPWEVMKEQLLQSKKNSDDSKKRKEAEDKRIENYENFLKEHKVLKRKATWCEFPETEQREISGTSGDPVVQFKKKSKKESGNEPETIVKSNGKVKKPKKKKNKTQGDSEPQKNTESTDLADSSPSIKKNKKKNVVQATLNELSVCNEIKSNVEKGCTVKQTKKKNKKKSDSTSEPQCNTESTDLVESLQSSNKNKKKKNFSEALSEPQSNPTQEILEDKQHNNSKKKLNNKQKQKKNKNLVDGKPMRRKEINDRSFQLIINGKEIELVRFDGFPVMKKDADRLEELKTSMIKKGIPKSEVQRTIKLERRRAEKALARVKRDVCYNCRKGGHVLSDCPELKSKIPGADIAEGVCFKCGSTEHRQFECKVQRDKEFRFATCFICKEPGHIARQCPDNPKGLYPNGGSCKLCGDVTHLRKDCPTITDKKEGTSIKLQTLDSGENIEDVGHQSTKLTLPETSKKPKKIKF